jgi:hypothetical protein
LAPFSLPWAIVRPPESLPREFRPFPIALSQALLGPYRISSIDPGNESPFSGHLGVCLRWEERQPCISFPGMFISAQIWHSSTCLDRLGHRQVQRGLGGGRWAAHQARLVGEAGLAWGTQLGPGTVKYNSLEGAGSEFWTASTSQPSFA